MVPFATASTVWTSVFADELAPAHLADVVADVHQPLYLIWTKQGDSELLTPEFAERAKGPTTVWEVSDGDHTKALETRPQEYEQRVVAFLDDALLGR